MHYEQAAERAIAPLHQPPTDAFSGFDDHASLIGSLHLDADEEPRRGGATSRANSVRFDESANQSHWSHPHRSSIDLIPRSGSSLGSHPMIERTYSHKSDGRQSSAGHSVHSATSGRANSLGIDTPFSGLGTSPMEVPGFTPGLLVLGSVPSIIRCWLNDNFKHDSLLYAAVCTGSHGSFLDERLIARLGYSGQVREESDRKVKLSVYFPEATMRGASSSRPSSPTPQLPSITVDFTVVNQTTDENDKSIQIFIGSDVLRAHNADVLFSANTITLFDDERCKLSIPMVRPENEQTFKSLRITSLPVHESRALRRIPPVRQHSPLNGLKQTITNDSCSLGSPAMQPSPRASLDEKAGRPSIGDDTSTGSARPSLEGRPSLGALSTALDVKSAAEQSLPSTTPRSASSSTIWGSWRRETDTKPTTQQDSWAKAGSSYQRREQGIKVLRPTKPVSRTFSATGAGSATSPGATTGQSRFFTDGSRRASLETSGSGSADGKDKSKDCAASNAAEGTKSRTTNPVGGASAFSWLSK